MADNKTVWTDEQICAITDKSSDILVSAAAGSGKTAVLTERLIRKITDPFSPVDISRILVVTFTEDAANELKIRIRDALTTAMAESPSNKYLQRQYLMLPSAKISTIHGFCLDLIRGNYELLGLTPKLRISDEGQNNLLMQQVADAVVEGYYAALSGYDDIDDFVEFADNFITLQDSSLTAKIIEIYKKLQSFPEGVDYLKKSACSYELEFGGVSNSIWAKTLFTHVSCAFNYYYQILNEARKVISEKYEEIADKYLPAIESSCDVILNVLSAINKCDYYLVRDELIDPPFEKMRWKKGYEDDDTIAFYKEINKEFREEFKKIRDTYFKFSAKALAETAKQCKEYITKLHALLSAFDRRFSYEKRKRGIIDFNDMERMAYSLLVRPDGSFTELASEVGARFDEVCIDEYQDVNSLQDGIFKAITRNTHRFMVGDMKQSIYAFRGAEPRIFADYRRDDSVKLISLTHNFRSDKPVIDISNEICGNLFTKLAKTVPYDKSDELYFANGSDEAQDPEIVVIEDKNVQGAEIDSQTDDTMSDNEPSTEATYVAMRVRELIDNGVSPSDIAILLRSAKKDTRLFENALSNYGIMSKNKDQKDLFSNPEIVLLLCILNVIDNPSRDIYLAGALKSPLYNVTLSELAEIRAYSEKTSLYDALVKYTDKFDFKKGKFFLKKLDEYRKLSNKPVDRLIWHIYCDSGLLAYASDDTLSHKGGKANLMKLYEVARSFESGTFKGLYNFIRFVNDTMNSDSGISAPSSADDSGVVQIMTIHKSKGLQFKYVFICGTAKCFNALDESSDIIIDRDMGTAIKLSDESGLATIDTFYRRVSALEIRKKSLEEEVRVLYVALTRAKSKIIAVATVKDAGKLKEISRYSKYLSASDGYVYSRKPNYISWMLLSQTSLPAKFISADDIIENIISSPEDSGNNNVTLDESRIARLTEEFTERFAFRYPSSDAARIPAKLSVSELYPTILDDFDDSARMSENKKPRMRVPRFIDENDSKGAKIGTATHQFMQFCDFDKLLSDGIDSEIKRMADHGFLSPSVASLVNKNAVRRFIESDLFTSLKNAKEINRELRFNVHLDASAFTENKASVLEKEKVLVQGIIDCLFVTSDGATVLLDYKTDFVSKEMTLSDAENMLIDRHRTQLSYYATACKTVLGRSIDKVLIYSFALGKAIEVPLDKLIKL